MTPSQEKVSKLLSYLLRHQPQSIGLTLDREGWAEIDELLDCAQRHGKKITRALIEQAVRLNDKKRFALSPDGRRIRAVQGHSSGLVDISYTPQTPPDLLWHGTATRFLDAIRAQGLLPGSRHYVHLSADAKTAHTVGTRHGKPVILEIDARALHLHGGIFHLADNGVWLIHSVPPAFILFPPATAQPTVADK